MIKITNRKPLDMSAVALIITVALCLGIRQAHASNITLRPDSSGRIFINTPMLVDISDTLSIPAGTTVEFRDNGSIFVRGRLDIGVTGYHGSSSQSIQDLVRGTKMTYSGSLPPIAIRGGMLTAFNVNFAGEIFLVAFQGSDVLISSSTFDSANDSSLISVYQDSRLDISSSVIKNRYLPGQSSGDPSGYAMIGIFSNSHATMTSMRFESPRSQSAIAVYNQSSLKVDDSRFTSCSTGITAFNSTHVRGVGNMFACSDRSHVAYNESTIELLAKSRECCSRVIFVPGIQGSRLYRRESSIWFGGIPVENQLWEPDSSSDVRKLFMSATGTSILRGIYSRNIIDRINIFGTYDSAILGSLSPSIYGSFISYLKKLKSDKTIDDYVAFPYDWRLGLADIPDNDLVAEIKKQASLASNEKVILIAHSYGGLVTKDALSTLEAEGKRDLVQSAIYVAVPETGAPQAIFAGLHGDQQSILRGFIMDAVTAIRLAANMPSAHLLTPSTYFAKHIALEFLNKKTGEKTAYASSTESSNRHSLTNIHEWLLWNMRSADRRQGQSHDSPAVRNMSIVPSNIVSDQADNGKDALYGQSAVLENAFRSYSIIGTGLPTPSGMLYRYTPCTPPIKGSFSDFGPLSPCLNDSALTRVTEYSRHGDGVVIFDGKDRRSGADSVISLAASNLKDRKSTSHADIMESADVQRIITAMIKATSSPQTDPFYDSASGTGSNPANPWINTNKVFGLDVTGFVEGTVHADVRIPPSEISASSASMPALQIITLDHAKKIQKISGPPDVLAVTTAINSADGWSFGSAGAYAAVSFRSLADQAVSITFSEHVEGSAGSELGSTAGGDIATAITESFSDIDVGFGSIMNLDMQYVTPDPSRVLVLDVDADGIGDLTIGPDQTAQAAGIGESGSPTPYVPLTYADKKTLALASIDDARIAISQLEIYALRRTSISMLAQMERYIRTGNPTFSLLAIKKKQTRFAEIASQYGKRLDRLQHGLLGRILPGFRFASERQRKESEILRIKAYLRDLARLKIILKAVEQKAIDLLV